ncbi:hypothetical protein E3P98_01120 [Wallemia ichthyophaga]|nr:hypothetical protein E3P98_01120 [Wallemia ichthyophaga]
MLQSLQSALRGEDKIKCFFCGASAPRRVHHSNTPHAHAISFTCASCHQHNAYGEDGEVQDVYAPVTAATQHQLRYRGRGRGVTADAHTHAHTNGERESDSPLCRTCTTNQTLVHTLLTNNQDECDGDAQLQRYRHALETRYPPLCSPCKAMVDEIIQQRDYKAKSAALGGLLARSRGSGSSGRNSNNNSNSNNNNNNNSNNNNNNNSTSNNNSLKHSRSHSPVGRYSYLVWCLRGAAWVLNNALYWRLHWCAYKHWYVCGYGHAQDTLPLSLPLTHPLAIPLTLLFACWDPSWGRAQKRRRRNGWVVVRGRAMWIRVQLLVWLERACLVLALALGLQVRSESGVSQVSLRQTKHLTLPFAPLTLLLFEVVVQAFALSRISVVGMRQLNLSSTVGRGGSEYAGVAASSTKDTPSTQPTDAAAAADNLHHALTLGNLGTADMDTLKSQKLPVFGEASLRPRDERGEGETEGKQDKTMDNDEMEWIPEIESTRESRQHPRYNHALKPQRFFAPQDKQRTGLEGPLSSVSLGGMSDVNRGADREKNGMKMGVVVGVLFGIILVLLAAVFAYSK